VIIPLHQEFIQLLVLELLEQLNLLQVYPMEEDKAMSPMVEIKEV